MPNQVEGLVIVWLYEKIQREEIDRNFTYSDIQAAIREVTASLNLENQPRTESVLTSLLHNFVENPSGSYERFTLTEYAQKFARLIEGKLNSPHKHFPLRQSFERYAHFKAEDIQTIDDFESWFRQGFDDTSRQTILDHLESLQDNVRSALNELNQILFAESEQSALKMAHEFSTTFNILGEKADEIRDTLTLDFSLKQEIQSVVNTFYTRLEDPYSTSGEAVYGDYANLEYAYQRSVEIQKGVNEFFKVVNEKIERIRNQIIFASSKLNELQEHFKYQSRFKVNLRKMLTLLLEEGRYAKEDLILPDTFPLKSIPYEGFKFVEVLHYSSFTKALNTVIELVQDVEHREREKLRMENVLGNQEKIAEWVEHYQRLLHQEKVLDFKEHFYKIFEAEGNIDIALQVGFELFQFATREQQFYVDVSKPHAEQLEKQEVITWNMKIHQK
ncbi:MAG: hypothetical protein R3A44_14200 [Caldilineaceae bacterium]